MDLVDGIHQGLIWYNKISITINNNIQSTIDKQYPYLEKLWNETTNNPKPNMSESEKGFEVDFTNPELINHKIEDRRYIIFDFY